MQHQPALQQVVALLVAAAGVSRTIVPSNENHTPWTCRVVKENRWPDSRLVAKKKVSGVPSSLSRSPSRVM